MKDKKQPFKYTSIGGSALIEGVMMRGDDRTAIALRKEDGGVLLKVESTPQKKSWYKKVPILRGIIGFIVSMILSYKCLMYSADVATRMEQEPPPVKKSEKALVKFMESGGMQVLSVIAMVLGVALALLLFIFLPAAIIEPLSLPDWGKVIMESVMKIVIFLLYLIWCSNSKEIKRVFQYHGAEHKTIFCFEHNQPLTPQNAAAFKRFHPRCGTSFLFLSIIVGIIISMFITWDNVWIRVALKVVTLPLVVGIAYEFIKLAGKYDNLAVRIISAPGLWFQRLTTKEPDYSQLEIAIIALRGVLEQFPTGVEPERGEDGEFKPAENAAG